MTRRVSALLIANVVLYFLTWPPNVLFNALSLIPAGIVARPWTIITYMFLHGGFGHLFFNMLALFFFGPRLEARLGGRHFLGLYFAAGITGAVLSLIESFTPLGSPYTQTVGASGAVFGVMLGFAYYWPRDRIFIWGILPVEARLFVGIMTALSLYFGFSGAGGGIAHFAHLGGFLGGWLYLKWMEQRSPARRFKAKAAAPVRRNAGGDRADLKRWERIPRDQLHPVNRDELDRVIEKIKQSGIGSLTADERAFLDRFAPD
ncbi:MAG: rhomboid family intramembrane serine protease [Gemmatimonadales bacterium]